jgi:hypothetical protein
VGIPPLLDDFLKTTEEEEASAEDIDSEPDRPFIAGNGRPAVNHGKTFLDQPGGDVRYIPPGEWFSRQTGRRKPGIGWTDEEISRDQQFAPAAIVDPDTLASFDASRLIFEAQKFTQQASRHVTLFVEMAARQFQFQKHFARNRRWSCAQDQDGAKRQKHTKDNTAGAEWEAAVCFHDTAGLNVRRWAPTAGYCSEFRGLRSRQKAAWASSAASSPIFPRTLRAPMVPAADALIFTVARILFLARTLMRRGLDGLTQL